jgi:predicted dehydrogenase
MKILQIGYGYWGKKITKTLTQIKNINEISILDPFVTNIKNFSKKVKFIKKIKKKTFDYIFIATPVKKHFFYINKFEKLGIPIFVEKPLIDHRNNNKLIKKIENKKIFTGYIYLYNKFIINLKKIIDDQKTKPLFIKFQRNNLGPIRKDVDVLYDLGSHDLSIINYLFEDSYVSLIKVDSGKILEQSNKKDYYNIFLKIKKTLINIEINWLNVVKERRISIFFKKKIIQYDEIQNKIIEKYIPENFYEKTLFNIDYLKIKEKIHIYKNNNPLKNEILTFIKNNKSDYLFNKKISFKTQKLLYKIKKFK